MAWWAAAAAALQIGTGVGQQQLLQAQADGQAAVNELNAESLEFDAFEAEQFGYSQVARYQAVVDKTLATRKATLAAQDVDTSFGTAKAVEEENELNAYLNTLDIVAQASNKARNIKRRASSVRLGADMEFTSRQAEGQAAAASGFARAGSTLANYYISQE